MFANYPHLLYVKSVAVQPMTVFREKELRVFLISRNINSRFFFIFVVPCVVIVG